ncbi:hypothetical protein BH11PLA2_BH11PLA2_28190 [soil metagenome]
MHSLKNLLLLTLIVAVSGCGSDKPPPQSTDPAAIEKENKQGKEIRNQLEK